MAKRRDLPPQKPSAWLRIRFRRLRALNPRLARGMVRSPQSAVRQHDFDALLERLGDHVVVAQSAEPLARFLLHAVIAAALRPADSPGTGDPEALGCRPVRLHFRHDRPPCRALTRVPPTGAIFPALGEAGGAFL